MLKKVGFLIAATMLSASALADVPKDKPTMKFLSIPIAEKVPGAHQVFPYRSRERVVVIVVDPIVCGQEPKNPRFWIKGGKIAVAYDLTPAPAGRHHPCTAHSTFDLQNIPDRDFSVEFRDGKEVRTAHMMRCPETAPEGDIWDCMVPKP